MLARIGRRLWTLLIILPLAVLLIVLAVANRQPVTLSADPVAAGAPLWAVELPLFVALGLALILGVVIGGTAVWFSQAAYRREARSRRAEAQKLARERDVQKEQISRLSGTRALPSPASLR